MCLPFPGCFSMFHPPTWKISSKHCKTHCLTVCVPLQPKQKILQVPTKSVRGRSALKSAYISGRMMNCLTSMIWQWFGKFQCNCLSDHFPDIKGAFQHIPTPFSPLFVNLIPLLMAHKPHPFSCVPFTQKK